MKTTETVAALVRETVESMGFELCDVEFVKEYANWVLTLYIDRPEGVGIDECEQVSRAVDPILDAADPIKQAYYLSVSSLGLDRPIRKDADFARAVGKPLEVRLYAPRDGKKSFSGVLIAYDAESFTIENEQTGRIVVKRSDASLIKPEIKF